MTHKFPATKQEIFNIVFRGAAAQNFKKSVKNVRKDEEGMEPVTTCMYRGDDGCKCFIGHLIHDDDYKPELEYKRPTALVFDVFFDAKNEALRYGFIHELQRVHDCSTSPANQVDRILEFAHKHQLELPDDVPYTDVKDDR